MKKLQEFALVAAAIAFLAAGGAFQYWYEFKYKPRKYAEEFIKAQQIHQEKSK